MKKTFIFLAPLAFLLGVSGGASAATVSVAVVLGTLAVPQVKFTDRGSTVATGNDFKDTFSFGVSPAANLINLTTAADTGGGSFITPLEVQVWQNAVGNAGAGVATLAACTAAVDCLAYDKISPGAPDALNDSVTLTVADLVIGTTYIVFAQGASAGSAAAFYVVKLDLTLVPLPPAAVLFLSALAGLAGFSRIIRRRRAATWRL